MNSFELAGQAMVEAQEGNRLIAAALWNAMQRGLNRVGPILARIVTMVPGPHALNKLD